VRILFTFAGGLGHFTPLLSTVQAMAADGHEVAVGAQAALLPAVAQAGFRTFDTGGNTFREKSARSELVKLDMAREYRSVSAGYAGRIARERAAAIAARAARWQPDLLVCDEMDFGGMVAAERQSIPHAAILVIASGQLAKPELLVGPLNDLRIEHGLPRDSDLTMLSRYLVLSPFPTSFRDPLSPLPATAHAFRPLASSRAAPPPWLAALPNRPTIYATLGTVFNVESGDLFCRLLEGLRTLPANIVATVGSQIDPSELGPQPENVWNEQYVDQWPLLPHCDLVVSHAGSGTMFGALAHGLPMLLLPIGADQPFNARRCEALGVARVLDACAATPDAIQDTAAALLMSASHRQAASRVRDEIAALPGQATAVALLNKLARERAPIYAP
jgi:UDP:flavonoid glycosyltransferase YjiC (YdhE family)